MAVFNFKTRGAQTAQGKQKVYFCAHPEDYEKYLEKISDEILNILEKENNHNCAFFYLEDSSAARDEQFLFSLKEMNLLVMPVTTKLLTTENIALAIEFKYATKNGIPVLPLMMESELEDLFNAKCGNLQFLDPNSRDTTAISYEEKLKKYLATILVGDELAQKIRNAFDAYIFLSYRKMDRQYAQELMKLIHKNDFCRDIAIWYDEFLTPGENFNDSIKAALEKSKLFALAVTPHLLEKTRDKDGREHDNYIVTTEYPMAQKANKLILPAELVETDKAELASKFENFPECINSKDEPILSKALLNALEGIALRENDMYPEHNFFIGLAYLGGIDVEKDIERALELITSAAEAGLIEAMEKLVSIYRNGTTGKIDIEKAIEWQQKVVFYKRNEAKKHLGNYIEALWNLGEYSQESKEYSIAKEVYNEMLNASQASDNILSDSQSRRDLASSYTFLGDVHRCTKEYDEARELYEKAHAISQSIQQDGSKQSMADLSLTYERLGLIYQKKRNWDKAKEYFEKSLELTLEIPCTNNTDMLNLSVSYEHMADVVYEISLNNKCEKFNTSVLDDIDVYETIKYLKLAKEPLEELMKQYLNKDPSPERTKIINRLLDIYKDLAKRIPRKNSIVRHQYSGCALELTKMILREKYTGRLPYEEHTRLFNAFSDYRYAHFCYSTDLFNKQSELIHQKQILLGQLSDEYIDDNPLNICSKDENIYFELGKITQSLEEYSVAQLWYKKALNCQFNKKHKNLEDLNKLVSIYENLGDCFMEEGDSESSITYYNEISKILSDNLANRPISPELMNFKDRIADIFEKIAFVLNPYYDITPYPSSKKEDEESFKYMFKCMETRKELFKITKNDCLMEKLALAYRNVSEHSRAFNVNEKECLDAAVSLLEELLNKCPNDPIYIFLIEMVKSRFNIKSDPNNPFDF